MIPLLATTMGVSPDRHGLYLAVTAGFAAALCLAAIRRDGPSVLAMAFGAIAAAHLAMLPATPLVWACTAFSVAAGMSLGALVLQRLCGERAFGTGMVATAGMMIALFASDADAAGSGPWCRPLAFGAAMHRDIDLLVRN